MTKFVGIFLSLALSVIPLPSLAMSVSKNDSLKGAKDLRSLGPIHAPITIVEFSDYGCPFCKRYAQTTFLSIKEELIEKGVAQYQFRDYPLKPAAQGAIAARCAAEQDRFWEMHRSLFQQARKLNNDLLERLAKQIGLDVEKFNGCRKSPDTKRKVMADLKYGQELGVKGTPHFFIGRIENNQMVDVRQLSGAQPLAAFEAVIRSLLTESERKKFDI